VDASPSDAGPLLCPSTAGNETAAPNVSYRLTMAARDLEHADHSALVRLMRRAVVLCALLALTTPWLSSCGVIKPSPTKVTKVEQEPGTGHMVPAERLNVPDLTKR
jgi:hypothetical protein